MVLKKIKKAKKKKKIEFFGGFSLSLEIIQSLNINQKHKHHTVHYQYNTFTVTKLSDDIMIQNQTV